MSQVVLEFSNQNDLELLLSFAKRLGAKILSINTPQHLAPKSISNKKYLLMQKAANDPLFQSDVQEMMDDFTHADLETA